MKWPVLTNAVKQNKSYTRMLTVDDKPPCGCATAKSDVFNIYFNYLFIDQNDPLFQLQLAIASK